MGQRCTEYFNRRRVQNVVTYLDSGEPGNHSRSVGDVVIIGACRLTINQRREYNRGVNSHYYYLVSNHHSD